MTYIDSPTKKINDNVFGGVDKNYDNIITIVK